MKETYRRKRNTWIWIGVGALVGEWITADASWIVESWDLAVLLSVLSDLCWVLLIGAWVYSSYCWAKYKGRSGWFALLGLIAPLSFLILWGLKDKTPEVETDEL